MKAILAVATIASAAILNATEPPKVGDKAPDFALQTLDGQKVRLSELTARENVMLVVLRGWPGYQCPFCERQVHEFISSAPAFASAGARLVFVYPGPADDLKAHAEEFRTSKGKQWPEHFLYVLDPDYQMVTAYGLRWDAPHETAYPSTFVLDRQGMVRFAHISHGHDDRTSAAGMIAELKKLGL